ncbi:G-protein-coupled receptor family protein [Heterostelium album PN500]|uniref:G-protein-coupled receptor family protein n=1 Tax=Heterostelium pallidum (strain ATCC 26659 / Pp 5 / PN500) TaxID=670386 RepID=D3BVK3_HETP5|nr:G-protein-coupled receptor family protein [Heterostelium album PN500]EFA74506.1 G-protein-coupled receptor family protein [Heterostelium album PN500]|eukprot:XP_020426640.1 G-protein-coupled receptor family protein [Heterostelium album PN500]
MTMMIGVTQLFLETQLKMLATSQSLDNDSCRSSTLLLLCSTLYPPCVTKQFSNESITFPSFPCQSVCADNSGKCSFYNPGILPIMNCSTINSFGQPVYPQNNTYYNLTLTTGDNITESIQCNSNYTLSIPAFCPSPLAFVPESEKHEDTYYLLGDSSCAIPCPFKVDTPQKEYNVKVMTLVLHSISFFCSILLVLINGVLPNEITNTMGNILFFAIGSMLISICFFQSTANDYFRCDGNRYIVQKDTRCGINGFFFQFGILITIFFWTMILYDYFVTIRMKKIEHYRRYTITIWTIICILTILPMATHQFASNYITPNCWIMDSQWQLGAFYVPAMIVMALGFLFTSYIIVKIFMLYKILKQKQVLIYNLKLIFVMLVVLFDFACIIAFKFYSEHQVSVYAAQLESWVFCLLTSENCQFVLPDYAVRVIQGISSSSLGIIGFLAFGIDPSVVTNFYQSKKVLWVLQVLGNSFSSSSKSSTSSSGKRDQRMTMLSESSKSGVSTSSPPSRTQSKLNLSINQSQAHLATITLATEEPLEREDEPQTEPEPLTEV